MINISNVIYLLVNLVLFSVVLTTVSIVVLFHVLILVSWPYLVNTRAHVCDRLTWISLYLLQLALVTLLVLVLYHAYSTSFTVNYKRNCQTLIQYMRPRERSET